MLGRWQPPVAARVTARTLAQSLRSAITGRADTPAVRRALAQRFHASGVALTDSGTSALTLACRWALPAGGTIALPAYACVDLLAASACAGLRVRLYDVDPATLSPDLDSAQRALARGADAIVVAHLFGYPADVPGVAAIADAHGAVVIEDAAQQAGGVLHDVPLGARGPLSVLSFGRGKGLAAGGGGALMACGPKWSAQVDDWQQHSSAKSRPGWKEWTTAAAIWAVGRPSLYGIPASIPGLHLGETIYKVAHEPMRLSLAAQSLVADALALADRDRDRRVTRAKDLMEAIADSPALEIVREIAGGSSGYLRLPVLDRGQRAPAPRLGIVRSYPRPLDEEPAVQYVIMPGEPPNLGAREICQRLFTLPTHELVNASEQKQLVAWARQVRSE
jgi:dTDP-4-amino-4,6-dideoxygalactose transaminase